MRSLEDLYKLIIDVPDFPKKGIVFKDITTLMSEPGAFSDLISQMGQHIPESVSKLVAIESRGFLLAAPLAAHLGLGLVLIRKPGKLPREVISEKYSLEYGEDQLELHKDDLSTKDQIIIIDDVLATGGTAAAAESLCLQTGAQVMGHLFLMQIAFLKGIKKLKAPARSLWSC